MKRSAAPSQKCGLSKKSSKFVTPYRHQQTIVTSAVKNIADAVSVPSSDDKSTQQIPVAASVSELLDYSTQKPRGCGGTQNLGLNLSIDVETVNLSPVTQKGSLAKLSDNALKTKTIRSESAKFRAPLQQLRINEVSPAQLGCEDAAVVKRYLNVVWCKRSAKKHKNWEGTV